MVRELTTDEKNKIITELEKRNCSTDSSWFDDIQILSRHVYNCTGKSISELLTPTKPTE